MVFASVLAGAVAAQEPAAGRAAAEAEPTLEQIDRVIANLPHGRIARPASRESLTPEQERFVRGILSGPRNGMSASQSVMLASPTLGDLLQRASAYARFAGTDGYSSVPPKLNELAILMAARFWRGEYIWNAHHEYAVRVGLDRAVVEAIRIGERPAAMETDVEAVYDFLDELTATRQVSDAAFNAVRTVLGGDRGVVDLVGTFALYSVSSMIVTVDQSEVPGVTQPYFPASTRTSSVEPADRFVDGEGVRIHYLDWGTAGRQPLILLHGIGRVAHTFDHVAPHFVDDYHVLAVDMRGHGDSGWDPNGNYLVEDYVSDIEAMVAHLGLDDIVLWGNSTGGRVAQVFAGLYPERVSALIVEDVGPERPRSIASNLAARIRREEAGWESQEALLEELRRGSQRTRPEVLRAYARFGSFVREEDGRTILKRDPRINDGFVPTDLWRFVREIQAPTIYILGGASTIVPPETQAALRNTLAQVEIVTMPGLGHYPSEENPEAFLDIVDRFLQRVTRD